MNTSKRGKKDTDLAVRLGPKWNQNLHNCMTQRGFDRKTFAAAFKDEYGVGNPTDVGRWMRVGDHSRNGSIIGFPSYENMKRIADFFEVTVGYLTGETDFKSFEMEKACSYLMISKNAGEAIENITKGKGSHGVDRYLRTDYTAAFEHLITAKSFPLLLKGLCHYAGAIYQEKHPFDYLDDIYEDYDEETIDIALDFLDEFPYEAFPDFPPKVAEIMRRILQARDDDIDSQLIHNGERIKAEKYSLSETFLQLVNETVNDDTVDDLLVRARTQYDSFDELEAILAADGSPL